MRHSQARVSPRALLTALLAVCHGVQRAPGSDGGGVRGVRGAEGDVQGSFCNFLRLCSCRQLPAIAATHHQLIRVYCPNACTGSLSSLQFITPGQQGRPQVSSSQFRPLRVTVRNGASPGEPSLPSHPMPPIALGHMATDARGSNLGHRELAQTTLAVSRPL